MTWLIILFALMLVISPVLWLKPSPRQQRVVRLRNAARKAGVDVKLQTPPFHEARGVMPAYRWGYPQLQPGPDFVLVRDAHAAEALEPFAHGWRWRIEPLRPLSAEALARLDALLTRLPMDAQMLESRPTALTLWWWESQDAARFVTYVEDFNALRDDLAGRPDRPEEHAPREGPEP